MEASAKSILDRRLSSISMPDFGLALLMTSADDLVVDDLLPGLETDSQDKLLLESGEFTTESRYPESGDEHESEAGGTCALLSLSESL